VIADLLTTERGFRGAGTLHGRDRGSNTNVFSRIRRHLADRYEKPDWWWLTKAERLAKETANAQAKRTDIEVGRSDSIFSCFQKFGSLSSQGNLMYCRSSFAFPVKMGSFSEGHLVSWVGSPKWVRFEGSSEAPKPFETPRRRGVMALRLGMIAGGQRQLMDLLVIGETLPPRDNSGSGRE